MFLQLSVLIPYPMHIFSIAIKNLNLLHQFSLLERFLWLKVITELSRSIKLLIVVMKICVSAKGFLKLIVVSWGLRVQFSLYCLVRPTPRSELLSFYLNIKFLTPDHIDNLDNFISWEKWDKFWIFERL